MEKWRMTRWPYVCRRDLTFCEGLTYEKKLSRREGILRDQPLESSGLLEKIHGFLRYYIGRVVNDGLFVVFISPVPLNCRYRKQSSEAARCVL